MPPDLAGLTVELKKLAVPFIDEGLIPVGKAMQANNFDEAQFVYLTFISPKAAGQLDSSNLKLT